MESFSDDGVGNPCVGGDALHPLSQHPSTQLQADVEDRSLPRLETKELLATGETHCQLKGEPGLSHLAGPSKQVGRLLIDQALDKGFWGEIVLELRLSE